MDGNRQPAVPVEQVAPVFPVAHNPSSEQDVMVVPTPQFEVATGAFTRSHRYTDGPAVVFVIQTHAASALIAAIVAGKLSPGKVGASTTPETADHMNPPLLRLPVIVCPSSEMKFGLP